jgi:hypothetical protein
VLTIGAIADDVAVQAASLYERIKGHSFCFSAFQTESRKYSWVEKLKLVTHAIKQSATISGTTVFGVSNYKGKEQHYHLNNIKSSVDADLRKYSVILDL